MTHGISHRRDCATPLSDRMSLLTRQSCFHLRSAGGIGCILLRAVTSGHVT